MSNLLKSKFLLGFAIVAVMFVAVMAVANVASAAYAHTMTLKMGMSNSQVMALQQTLNAAGFTVSASGAGSPGMESMYFGAKTKAAVMAFQSAKGLTADGVVGPNTGAALAAWSSSSGGGSFPAGCTSSSGYSTTTGMPCNSGGSLPAGCTSSAGYSPLTGAKCDGSSGGGSSSGPLQGGAGSLNDASFISSISNEDVGEGDDNVKVVGLDLEADDGSDLRFTAIRLEFEEQGAGGSDDFDDYADSVSVWFGSDKVGEASVDDFSEDAGVWSKTINLANSTVVQSGETGKLYVAVSALSNIDSGDLGAANNDWNATVDNIRYMDASGAIVTDSSTGDLGTARDFQFESFASATGVELKLTEGADNPEEQIVEVDDATETEDVVLLSANLKADGSDIDLNSITVDITASGPGAANVNVASAYSIWIDGEEVESLDAADCITAANCNDDAADDAASYLFDDEVDDMTIDEGDTVTVEVRANVLGTDDTVEGAALAASLDIDDADAEDESGEDLGAGDKTGAVTGEAQHFYTVAPEITKVSVDIDKNAGEDTSAEGTDDTADGTIVFKVKAIGGDIYINGDNETTDEKEGILLTDGAGGDLDALGDYSYTVTGSNILTTNGGADNEYFTIPEGSTATFTVSFHIDSAADGFFGGNTSGVQWGTVSTDQDTRSANNYNFGVVADDLETSLVQLDDGA